MVTLSAVFDAPQESQRRVSPQVVIELYVVEVLDCDPSEDRPRLLYVGGAPAD